MALVSACELDTSPPEWTIEGILPRVGVVIVRGESTVGKSLTVIDMALAVCNGRPWFGHATIRGKVVYALGEGLYDAGCRKQARLARQARDDAAAVEAVRRADGDEAADVFAAQLPPFTDELLYVIPKPFPVPVYRIGGMNGGRLTPDAEAAVLAIGDEKQGGPPELVILDSLPDFTGGLSLTNDASANRLMLGMKEMAARLDCCVVAIAHNDKGGQNLLGAQRLFNAADEVISLKPDDVSAPGADRTAAIECEKSKYGPKFQPMGYRIEGCAWDEPLVDDEGNPTGETAEIRSATVRLLEDDQPSGRERKPAVPLPDLRDVTVPRKRSGLRPRLLLRSVPDVADGPVTPGPVAGVQAVSASRDRDAALRDLLTVPCPVCSRPPQVGCDARMTPKPWPIGRAPAGPVFAHEDRVWAVFERDGWQGAEISALLDDVIAALSGAAEG